MSSLEVVTASATGTAGAGDVGDNLACADVEVGRGGAVRI